MTNQPDDQSPDMDALNEYLDGDSPSPSSDGIPKSELAKHLLVAGVTRHLLQEAAATTSSEDCVQAGMQVLIAEDDRARARARMRRLAGSLAAAAAVLITAILYFWPNPTFDPLLDRIDQFVRDDLDREYRMKLEFRHLGESPFGEPKLLVRGIDHFAAGIDLSFFGREVGVWQGHNGEERWLVIPDVLNLVDPSKHTPIYVTNGSLRDLWIDEELENFGQGVSQGLGLLENAGGIFSLLATMRDDYEFTETPDLQRAAARLPTGEADIDLTANRRPGPNTSIPDTIRMIVEERTGVVRTIVLSFSDWPGSIQPFRKIRYELVSESVKGDNLYEHFGYHDGERPVVRR